MVKSDIKRNVNKVGPSINHDIYYYTNHNPWTNEEIEMFLLLYYLPDLIKPLFSVTSQHSLPCYRHHTWHGLQGLTRTTCLCTTISYTKEVFTTDQEFYWKGLAFLMK